MLPKQQSFILSPYTELYNIRIPKDHLLRQMDELADFSFVYEELNERYCQDNGRTAVDPVRMFKNNHDFLSQPQHESGVSAAQTLPY